MIKRSIYLPAVFLVAWSATGLCGCDRQVPPPKAVKELPQPPETVVGGMARSAIEKAKGVEATLGEASSRAADTGKEAVP